jgi:hypothetical protein
MDLFIRIGSQYNREKSMYSQLGRDSLNETGKPIGLDLEREGWQDGPERVDFGDTQAPPISFH